jgi:hypothetical protein
VEQGLLKAFAGFFNPNRFTFGANLYISKIFAEAMAVSGIASAEITRLARLHAPHPDRETAANLAKGFLTVGADEIVRLDNDPNFPQHGTLSVVVTGGAG